MDKVRIYRAIFGLSVAILILSALFRIQHWPFGLELALAGLIAIAISAPLFYSAKLEKSFVDELAIVLVPILCGFMLLRLLHLSYQSEIKFGLLAIALIYTVFKGIQWHRLDKSDDSKGINWERNAYLVGIILVGIGLFLRNQHWPYSSGFLLSGMGVATLYYILPMFLKDDEN